MQKAIALAIFSMALSGCATKFYVPGNRFMTPEASGEFLRGEAKLGAVGVTHIEVVDSNTNATPDTTPKLIKNSSAALGVQLGLHDRVDAYYAAVFGAPSVVGGKIQILGEPARESKAGNFSLALAGGVVFGSQHDEQTINNDKGESDLKFNGWEALVLIGYRATDNGLIYLNPFVTRVNADITVKRTSSGVTSTTATPNGQGEMRGLTLGARAGKSAFINFEASLTEMTWTRKAPTELSANKFSDAAFGLAVGGAW